MLLSPEIEYLLEITFSVYFILLTDIPKYTIKYLFFFFIRHKFDFGEKKLFHSESQSIMKIFSHDTD